jgi:hypothetical protein
MDTLIVDKSQVVTRTDSPAHMNSELRASRGVLRGVVAGVILWCLVGLAVWFGFH